jgi:hypothetical protein
MNIPAGHDSISRPHIATVAAPTPDHTRLYTAIRRDSASGPAPSDTRLSTIGQLAAPHAVYNRTAPNCTASLGTATAIPSPAAAIPHTSNIPRDRPSRAASRCTIRADTA